jgi:spore germination protein KC
METKRRRKAMRRGLTFLILLPFLFTTLTGCWDRREIEERTSAFAIGIDKSKENKDHYTVTVQIPIPIKIAGGGGGEGGAGTESVKVLSSTGKTIGDAMMKIQQRTNQVLFFGHTRVIVIGEEVARQGVKDIMDGFRRDPQLRRLLWPLVIEGRASEFLRLNPEVEQIPTVFFMGMIESGSKAGFIPDITLGDFFVAMSNRAMQPTLNHLSMKGEKEVQWLGLAVFQKDRLVGFLDEHETWMLMQMRQEKPGGDFLVKVEDEESDRAYATFRPKFVTSKMKVDHNDGKVDVKINVHVQGNVIETTYPSDFTKEGNIRKLEKELEKKLTQRADQLVNKLQKKLKSDVLLIGLKVKGYHYRDLWEKIDWHKEFPNANIEVTYNVSIRRIGMELK